VSFGAEAHASATADSNRIQQLIADLGSPKFSTREEATRQLIALGEPAAMYLGEAVNAPDPEVRLRARQILAKIGFRGVPEVDPALQREVDALLEPVTRSDHPNLQALTTLGVRSVPALIVVCNRENNRQSVYAMIALTRLGGPRAFPALARLFQVKHIAPHLRGYVAEIKDPRMIFHLIKTWQELGADASPELRSQVALMAGVKMEDDPAKWMAWFREKYGDKL